MSSEGQQQSYEVDVTREGTRYVADLGDLGSTFATTLAELDHAVREVIVLGADLPDDTMAGLSIAWHNDDAVLQDGSSSGPAERRGARNNEAPARRTGRGLRTKCANRDSNPEPAEFERVCPDDLDVHLVLDNHGTHNTHNTRAVHRWLLRTHVSSCTSPRRARPG